MYVALAWLIVKLINQSCGYVKSKDSSSSIIDKETKQNFNNTSES